MHDVVECRATDSKDFGRPRQIAIRSSKRCYHGGSFSFVAYLTQIDESVLIVGALGKSDIVTRDLQPFGHDHRALDAVFQFADISGPGMRFDGANRVVGERQVATVLLTRKSIHESMGEEGRIPGTVTQRGNRDDDFRQAVEQVFAESTFLDQALKILMGCTDNAHIDRNLTASAQSLDDTLLQEAQQFGLKSVRQITDFVQHQCSAIGGFDLAESRLGGTREMRLFRNRTIRFPADFPEWPRN